MERLDIINQGINICRKQIDYIEFGLKESEKTTYLVTTINILNYLMRDYFDKIDEYKESLIPFLNKIKIEI